jgi:hypothetical protein
VPGLKTWHPSYVSSYRSYESARTTLVRRITTALRKKPDAAYSPLSAWGTAVVRGRIPSTWPAPSTEVGTGVLGPESSARATQEYQISYYPMFVSQKPRRTYLFKSALSRSGLTPTRFRIIFAINSSRKTTISCPMNLIRHGFDPNTACAILFPRRCVKVEGMGRRGRRSDDHGSLGPGTNRK